MARKLATVRTISRVDPIEGRDFIGLAHVDGWGVIVQKSEFKPGDLCVYCEIDSVMPDLPQFAFLKEKRGTLRIRSLKLSGVLSQGIAFPMSVLPPGDWQAGDDVTDVLGVTLYEPEPPKQPQPTKPKGRWGHFKYRLKKFLGLDKREMNKPFPAKVAKTDQERIQNIPGILGELIPVFCTCTEKIDGTSATFLYEKTLFGGRFTVCSRNFALPKKKGDAYWDIAEKYKRKERLAWYCKKYNTPWACIQGELAGPKIQGNKYKLTENRLYIFNLIDAGGFIDQRRMTEILLEMHSVEGAHLDHVPLLRTETILHPGITLDELLANADGPSQLNSSTLREGVVIRTGLRTQPSFKAISNKFLLKYKC